ncbi:Vault protein inter-alpha-trypsin [Thalassoglobus neptunius]|uniref:Vault protein inter-alpha-trypsin n=1 Tax=Thalassoglobus neptunius TaxID=1938619 RepID=A0A5C5WXR9_9PLAN|nr:VIT domain-containing protein [Thalassoglobus neptunius]TWT55398.1 Vault protein inter-alpha-trypsin [Thalassoglobus neptunius]
MTDSSLPNRRDENDLSSTEEDRQIQELLGSLELSAADVDLKQLSEIRKAVSNSLSRHYSQDVSSERSVQTASVSIHDSEPQQKWTKTVRTLLLAATTALAIVIGWFATTSSSQASPLTLGQVIDELDQAESLELTVRRGNDIAEVLISESSRVRWQDSPLQYQIARGSRLWQVEASEDEPIVTNVSRNPWQRHDGKVDVLSLMGVPLSGRVRELNAQPDGFDSYAGTECRVFRTIIRDADKSMRLQVYVDAESNALKGLVLREWGSSSKSMPLGELTLVQWNVPVDEKQFRVPVHLKEEDRIGTLTDFQGLVSLRPLGNQRWTPIIRNVVLRAGDWCRTDVRGANAVTLEMRSGNTLILGPGSLVELISETEVRLASGWLQVSHLDANSSEMTVVGPDRKKRIVDQAGKQLFRVDESNSVVELTSQPNWLAGYEGTEAADSVGELIVEVDGRSTPLTVGEHHVTVEIRDQIARTTIEETFVNHTNARLEGKFRFPLPQDASISGFGMWIHGELIEADIVEKQRAREIYETILREKRDPGLLEWTGGNIFQARVFPIEPHSEKRIKITYTQVLPLQGDRFRYSYGLRSELLQKNPVRNLSLRCLIHSRVPLSAVDCPTHPCRTTLTEHSAELEFSSQEYRPESDFEVVCDVSQRENDVIMIPHRRGDDGYFLLQLMPPDIGGEWSRSVIGNSEPLEIILLCDTSGSIDEVMRSRQSEFVRTLLGALGDEDRVLVATTDVTTDWLTSEFEVPDAELIARVEKQLQERVSLGWSDLEQAFELALRRASANSQIIYLGDGIVTTHESDPAEFIQRANRLVEKHFSQERSRNEFNNTPTVHAVSLGSTYESTVLSGLSRIGSGSMRQISGEVTGRHAAIDLLQELTSPGLKDVQVDFHGVRVAAVYPESLPNVPLGTQQTIVGRFLPTKEMQHGQVIVTGMQDGKPVRYVARIQIDPSEDGNSFIPRLWARAHLDHLLQQGTTQQIQNEVIALSEEFHIITPYTSLLVLETDEDRERFGVKKRFGMRDGERFFADGKSAATEELKQKQMQTAGSWRLGLVRQFQQSLSQYGRGNEDFNWLSSLQLEGELANEYLGTRGSSVRSPGLSDNRFYWGETREYKRPSRLNLMFRQENRGFRDREMYESLPDPERFGRTSVRFENGRGQPEGYWSGGRQESILGDHVQWFDDRSGLSLDKGLSLGSGRGIQLPALRRQEYYAGTRIQFVDGFEYDGYRGRGGLGVEARSPGQINLFVRPELSRRMSPEQILGKFAYIQQGIHRQHQSQLSWVRLFPQFDFAQRVVPSAEKTETWSDQAIDLADSLLRIDSLNALSGGIQIKQSARNWDDRFDRLVPKSEYSVVWSSEDWASLKSGVNHQAVVNWKRGTTRGVFSHALHLGQKFETPDEFEEGTPIPLQDYSLASLLQQYWNWSADVESQSDESTILRLTHPSEPVILKFEIDPQKKVLLNWERIRDGVVEMRVEFRNFERIAGRWWATEVESSDPSRPEHSLTVTNYEIAEFERFQFESQLEEMMQGREDVLELTLPLPKLSVARSAIQEGKGTVEDHFVMMCHYGVTQRWPHVFDHLRALEELAVDQRGSRWMRISIEKVAGRHEDARQTLVEILKQLGESASTEQGLRPVGELERVKHALAEVYPIIAWPPYRPVVENVRPNFAHQPDSHYAMLDWYERWQAVLNRTDQGGEEMALSRKLTEEYPGNVDLQISHAQRLAGNGRQDEAEQFLAERIDLGDHWQEGERIRLRENYADLLSKAGKYEELLTFLDQWMNVETTPSSVYARYLAAKIFLEQIQETEDLAREWLALARQKGELSPRDRRKVDAAIQFAFGGGHGLNRANGMDNKWLPELLRTATYCLDHADRQKIVPAIAAVGSFSETDEGDRFRWEVLQRMLANDGLTLDQWQQFQTYLQRGRLLVIDGDNNIAIRQITTEEWQTIRSHSYERWKSESRQWDRYLLGESLQKLLDEHFPKEALEFYRERISSGPTDFRNSIRSQFFDWLLTKPWTPEIEDEVFAVWKDLAASDAPLPTKIQTQVPALKRCIDALIQNRIQSEQSRNQDRGDLQELTRSELFEQQQQAVENAYRELAERLKNLGEKLRADNSVLDEWVELERIRLNGMLGEEIDTSLTKCWGLINDRDFLDTSETDIDESTESSEERWTRWNDLLLRERALHTVTSLSLHKSTPETQIQKLLSFVDDQIQRAVEQSNQLAEDIGEQEHVTDFAEPWKQLKFQLLVVFDRPQELITQLKQWAASTTGNVWDRHLTLLHAEQGEIEAAIQRYESIQESGELDASELRLLSDWYLIAGERELSRETRFDSYRAMSENELLRDLNTTTRQIQGGQSSTAIDDDMLLCLQALSEKSGSASSYYGRLSQLYVLTRDFRLLKFVPEAILGTTQHRVYEGLRSFRNVMLNQLQEEATADELIEHLKKLQQQIRSGVVPRGADSNERSLSLDLRALDLMEAMVEWKAATVPNQPGSHARAAAAALQRAFQHDWESGERLRYASYLSEFETLSHQSADRDISRLRETRESQLLRLYEDSEVGSHERAEIAKIYSTLRFPQSDRKQDALQFFENALNELADRNGGFIPLKSNGLVRAYAQLLEEDGKFYAAEQFVLKQRNVLDNQEQQWVYEEYLTELYDRALRQNARVGLAKQSELPRAVLDRLEKLAAQANEREQREILLKISNTFAYLCSHSQSTNEDVMERFENWANQELPELLRPLQSNDSNIINQVADDLSSSLHPAVALEFLLDRFEEFPKSLMFMRQDPWDLFGTKIGSLRGQTQRKSKESERERIAIIEQRLLEIVLDQLRNELIQHRSQNRSITHRYYGHFWSEKTDDFVRMAKQVLRKRSESPRTILYTAEYLFEGLNQREAAASILSEAADRGLLDQSGLRKLVDYLHVIDQYRESIPTLKELRKQFPDDVNLWVQQIRAHARIGEWLETETLLAEAEEHFHRSGRWVEQNMIPLANVFHEVGSHKLSAQFYEEAISLHQRSQPDRGIGNGVLSGYYRELANVYVRLEEPLKALHAASGAVVSWGHDQNNRDAAIENLRKIIAKLSDLELVVEELDWRADEFGADSPLVRKEIGSVWLQNEKVSKAIEQLQLAEELSPDDNEIQTMLIKAFDATGNQTDAIKQRLIRIDRNRHDLEAYIDLAQRSGIDPLLAERAATSIVESGPNDPKTHQQLAEYRMSQHRWSESLPHWERVIELNRNDPAGLIGRANAEIALGNLEAAHETLRLIESTDWPDHFENVDDEIKIIRGLLDGQRIETFW